MVLAKKFVLGLLLGYEIFQIRVLEMGIVQFEQFATNQSANHLPPSSSCLSGLDFSG